MFKARASLATTIKPKSYIVVATLAVAKSQHHINSVGNKTFRKSNLIFPTEIFNFQLSTFN